MPYRDFPFVHAAAHISHPGRDHPSHGPRLLSPRTLCCVGWRAGHGAHVENCARVAARARRWQPGRSRCSSPRRSLSSASTASCPIPSTTGDCAFWILRCSLADAKRSIPGRARVWRICLPEWRSACRSSSSRIWACRFWRRPSAPSFWRSRSSRIRCGSTSEAPPETRTLLSDSRRRGRHLLACRPRAALDRGHRQLHSLDDRVCRAAPFAALSLMLGVYRDPSLLWTLPCVLAALALLWLPHASRSFIARRVGFKPAGRASPPSPCSPRRFSSRSPPCCIYDDADSARRQPAGALAAAARARRRRSRSQICSACGESHRCARFFR